MAQDHYESLFAKLSEHGSESSDFIHRNQIDLETVVGQDISLREGASMPVRRLGRIREELLPIRSLSAR